MRRVSTALVVLAMLEPVASHATDLNLPEIGVRITNLPEGAAKSKDVEFLDGYSVLVNIGGVILSITQLDDPVPEGATLSDASFRKALQDNFGDNLGPKARSEATAISGHPAWTEFLASHQDPAPFVEFTCVTYVIANERPYRLKTYATTPYRLHETVNKPAGFDAAVQAMADTTFGPVVRTPAPPGTSPKFPRFVATAMALYPEPARARNEEGIVDVEFGVDDKGHARDIKQIYASSPHLDSYVPAYLRGLTFRLPVNWEQNGLQNLRFTMEFQFALATPPQACRPFPQPRIPDASVVTVCGSRLRPP